MYKLLYFSMLPLVLSFILFIIALVWGKIYLMVSVKNAAESVKLV